MGWSFGDIGDELERFGDRVMDEVQRGFDRVQAFERRFREDSGMDEWGGSAAQDWLRKNGPFTIAFFDTIGVGLAVGHLGWEELDPTQVLLPWTSDPYRPTHQGFVIEFSHELLASELIVDPNTQQGNVGLHTFFVGHLPDCEFDELTLTMTGGEPVADKDRLPGQFVGANVYQAVDPSGDDTEILTISGIETHYDPNEPGRIYRQSLHLPWGSTDRVSETYGGPTRSRVPTFVSVYAAGVDLLTPDIDDFRVQVTVRFVAPPLR